MDTLADPATLDVWTDVEGERVGTPATVVTGVRTVVAVVLAGTAASEHSLRLLVAALLVYWVGDMLDGAVARFLGCETRIGAALDILCDRFCAAAFYVGLMWLRPHFAPAVLVYLAEFMVVDCFLSLAYLAWPIRSPNYFFVVDRPLWLWNWSKPGKAVNSSLFAVLLLVTGWWQVGVVIATGLLVMKCVSLVRLTRLGLPVPTP
ncbi:MAG: CDP-diacylglycerol---glycerol-3-phosphate 3-phosphatidyltransferase [Nocardioidaceae bacterium]|nr:CDP-diacylglycerol---glycerol-3-phosphate 3-phosphatidyltransferase [Nocardioidaceae bacterium]